MDQLFNALKEFETRNNITASVIIQSDESFGLVEFWSDDDLGSFDSYGDLLKFLQETQYILDDKGICHKPCTIKPPAATDTAKG